MFKKFIQRFLERYATRLLAKYQPKVVTVTGSVGKTSTKDALTTVLNEHFKVLGSRSGYSNYNVDVAVPVMLFGLDYPKNVHNPLAWLVVLMKMRKILRSGYPYEVVVLELGTDKPGDIASFANYIKPDIAVVTAISPEHMEQFGTLEMVAREELAITSNAKMALINRDDIDISFDHFCEASTTYTYGFEETADYQFKIDNFSLEFGFDGKFLGEGLGELSAQIRVVGKHNIKPVMAAVAAATELGMPHDKIARGVDNVEPVSGRMNLLHGAEQSIIIDDSYNSSPLAATAALKTLYEFKGKQRIAILGSMNELGDQSEEAHKEVGEACDPKKLDLVVTVGDEADKYLAPAAKARGCKVESFLSPYDAGAFVRAKLEKGTVVLVKGSQNHVFTEEAAKLLLADTADEKELVRQTPEWIKVKQTQFNQL
ncbi:MAG TPA: UDP-N-acetylmuramoyl-tripeptide--D-alanyl-D-alanine ligase [Candidatus Saccharimonadales bacterium]|nr:UDP-N-acetylmuramoyl-tripeptide--D-alanyl-D-alanine ligase [Candidatus Saccharimonadales bacterium]